MPEQPLGPRSGVQAVTRLYVVRADQRIEGGSQVISERLASDLGERVLLGRAVLRIDDPPNGPVRVVTSRETLAAERVIATYGGLEDVGGLDWRWIAAFTSGSNDPKMVDAAKLSTTAFRASFGPIWGTPGVWEVAAYMNFVYASQEEEGDTPDLKDTGSYTSFPGYNLAMEYYLNKWLVARGGVMSHNATDTFKEEVAAGGEDEVSARNYEFMWTLGLGVDKGAWGLDLALEENDVHSGYLPLNGSVSSEPIAYMTAWLAW